MAQVMTKDDLTNQVIAIIGTARGEVYEPGDKQLEAAAAAIVKQVLDWGVVNGQSS